MNGRRVAVCTHTDEHDERRVSSSVLSDVNANLRQSFLAALVLTFLHVFLHFPFKV